MSESSQTTKSARSTRSKAKIESALIIKDVVPVTTVHASKPKVQSRVAEKKGKGKSVEKKKTSKVSDAISPSGNQSEKGTSKRNRRDYKSKFSLSMSDLVFESNVNTSEKATEVNPKTVSDVVETIVPTGDNPSLEKLGSDAEKRDLNAIPVETEMEDTPTEVEPNIANKSPTIAEMVAEKSIPVVTEEVVMTDVETSLNEQEEVETAEKEPVMEAAAEKDVETTDTTSESTDEVTRTADEGTSDNEGDTQSEESNQSIPTEEPEIEADKSAGVEKEKEKDVVDVDDYVTAKTAVKSTGGITKRLRSCTGKAVATASKTPAPRVKTKGVGPVKGRIGGSFAVWSVLFSTFDCSMVYIRKKEDPWNSILAGAATGGFLSFRQGFAASARSAAFGGVLLGLIEGAGIAFDKFSSAQQPMMEDIPPPAVMMEDMPPKSSWFGGLFGGAKDEEKIVNGGSEVKILETYHAPPLPSFEYK
ncbi:unnamed protein product [Trifolium pratense]|uniref:Uncharacterized protein n=1 Tax=Trifolium pratense TaxID=57577 RepID=A0ACB0JG79_TRIPR|nr:unnamed protein product [Trifolium pratense]